MEAAGVRAGTKSVGQASSLPSFVARREPGSKEPHPKGCGKGHAPVGLSPSRGYSATLENNFPRTASATSESEPRTPVSAPEANPIKSRTSKLFAGSDGGDS